MDDVLELLCISTRESQAQFITDSRRYLTSNSYPENPQEAQETSVNLASFSTEIQSTLQLLNQRNQALTMALCCKLQIIPEGSSIREIHEVKDYLSCENGEHLTEDQMYDLECLFCRALRENLGELANHEELTAAFLERISSVHLHPRVVEYLSGPLLSPMVFFHMTHALGLHNLRIDS